MNTLATIETQEYTRWKGQSGFTLIETIIVLIIAIVVIGGAAKMASKGFSSSKLADTEQNLLVMRADIQGMFTSSNDYTGLDNSLVIKAGLAPKSFIKANALVNAWGGDINIATDASNASWSIEFTNIPQEECTKLAVFQPDAWLSVSVNGSDVSGGDVSAATSSCGESNTITFVTR